MSKKKPARPCLVCGRSSGDRRPRCIRCDDDGQTPRGRMLPTQLPGRYLAVDPGAEAGYAIVEAYDGCVYVHESGQVGAWTRDPEQIVTRARSLGCEALVMEQPGLGPSLPPRQTYGLGRAAGVWWWLWLTSGERAVIVEIPAMTWRATEIGGGQRTSAEWVADARRHVRASLDREAGPDEAMALCLAGHALRSLAVADAVGVRRLARLGWREPRGAWIFKGRFVEVP